MTSGEESGGASRPTRMFFSAVVAAGFAMLVAIGFVTRPVQHIDAGPVTVTAYAPIIAPAAPSHIVSAPPPPAAFD